MRKGIIAVGMGLVALLGLLVATARAVQEELLEEARKIVAEAKPLIEQANDVDLKMDERKGPRKLAFQKLKQARDLYDKYLDANPGMEDKIDKEYTDVFSLLYWLKKDSSLGELEKDTAAPDLPQSPGPKPDGGDKPGPAAGGGDPAGGAKPGTDKGDPPGPPKNETPSEYAFRAKRQFTAITDYEKSHPGDLPMLKQFYEKFLTDFPDLSLPEYALAVAKLGKLNDRMSVVLKEVAKRDPDTIAGRESKAESAIFGKLTGDFNSKDMDVRRHAAELMAASRARSATYFLARGLADKDEQMAKICRDGLIALGGTNVGDNLVKLYRDASKEKQQAALDVLSEITKKGPVDALAESQWIGHFVVSNESDIAEASIALLKKLGKVGGPGLMFGLDSKFIEKKVDCINALAEVKYYRAARTIGERWLGTSVPPALHNASLAALESMGVYCIPFLISSMGEAYCPWIMNKITGQSFILRDTKKARAWWNANKPKDAEDP